MLLVMQVGLVKTYRLLLIGLILAIAPSVLAQAPDDAPRDPYSLAQRFLDVPEDPADLLPELAVLYDIGDTRSFFVTRAEAEAPESITATLAAQTPLVYLWVEDGVAYDEEAMAGVAGNLSAALQQFGYVNTRTLPTSQTNQFRLPDVDNDAHIYVLYAENLAEARPVYFNPNDSLPAAIAPGGYSNEAELIVVNLGAMPESSPQSAAFLPMIIRVIIGMQIDFDTPQKALWQRDGEAWLGAAGVIEAFPLRDFVVGYIANADFSLTAPVETVQPGGLSGGRALFNVYLQQRYGPEIINTWYQQAPFGMVGLDMALEDIDSLETLTGRSALASDAFMDFALTLALNSNLGDGRFQIRGLQITADELAAPDTFPLETIPGVEGEISQFATRYLRFAAEQPTVFTIEFDGAAQTPLLPLESDPDNLFYWSGSGPNRNPQLIRTFDLTDVDAASLTFDAWHLLMDNWSYAYVSASTDGGETWTPLSPESATENRYGIAYGPGLTGASTEEAPYPYPLLGVNFDSTSTLQITEIVADGPAADTDLRAGDVIAGYNGEPWPDGPDILGMLDQYRPGDEVSLYIQRGREFIDVPVTLGEHPTRVVVPPPVWQPQRYDLNDYVGEPVDIRIETVTYYNGEDAGIAIDNIAVDATDFNDDASEADVWEQVGWQRVDNQVRQAFAVQSAATGGANNPPRVRRLIGVDDEPSGEWRFTILPGETFVLAISGMSLETRQNARFTLGLTVEGTLGDS